MQRDIINQRRKELKELHKKFDKINDEDDDEEPPKNDQITLQITDTKTYSDKVEIKTEKENKGLVGKRNLNFNVNNNTVPPGPGQYTLPSSVIHSKKIV